MSQDHSCSWITNVYHSLSYHNWPVMPYSLSISWWIFSIPFEIMYQFILTRGKFRVVFFLLKRFISIRFCDLFDLISMFLYEVATNKYQSNMSFFSTEMNLKQNQDESFFFSVIQTLDFIFIMSNISNAERLTTLIVYEWY